MTTRCLRLSIVVALSAMLLACGGYDGAKDEATSEPPTGDGSPASTATETDEGADFSVTSDVFKEGELIPPHFTCDGEDVSPALSWEGAPSETRSFALIMDDPDAPGGTFNHWLIYNMDTGGRSLPENVEKAERPANGASGLQGQNHFGDIGYRGPCPPEGETHRYEFRLYAVDGLIDMGPGASRQDVLDALEGHLLGVTILTGTYPGP